ncbi:leucine-rich repeat-containing protein 18 [Austrofundulus limnaeus]|uniref:Leucine-rich repeat-containing protein 18 n=1 Tax=Austrofundulus limnaeus TaxID=52670 RepID=A0A2I4C2S8_AUSLI|nr:PREDICTED: leucine-rich repeat-containing protein 18 [Austrofundulus limnaeus]
MPKGKEAKGTKVTLKTARKAIKMTLDGRRRLTLSNMGLTIFPNCLFKLDNVEELDLSRNLIQKLPDNIGDFLSLRFLDVHSNKLVSVPESIGSLVELTHLNLANNCLTSAGLPSSLGSLTKLKSLNLGMNQLDALPHNMERLVDLQELGLFDNRFIKLPDFVKTMQKLTKLNVARNPLAYLKEKSEQVKKKMAEPKNDMYLVHESTLCKECLQKCKAQRERLMKGERSEDRDKFDEKEKISFAGLITPNSVASVTQDVWRMKDNVKNKKIK